MHTHTQCSNYIKTQELIWFGKKIQLEKYIFKPAILFSFLFFCFEIGLTQQLRLPGNSLLGQAGLKLSILLFQSPE